ncbi:MAG: copper-binding protein [Bradyrhizobium sp.]
MKTTSIMLAGLAALTLGSAALAQQPMTGTVTRIDRLDGTIAIQLQKTPTQSGTVGANTGGAKTDVAKTDAPAEELKTKVQGNLLNTLHAGDRVKFSLTEAGGTKTISNVERQ